jgi:hypothetical protein
MMHMLVEMLDYLMGCDLGNTLTGTKKRLVMISLINDLEIILVLMYFSLL